jgi:hypothetical protein
VTSLPAPTRVIQQLLLSGALLSQALECSAADGLSIVPAAHGPLMMFYVRQPLAARGAARVYGLRVEQLAAVPTQAPSIAGGMPGAIPGTIVGVIPGAIPGQREIIDLQIRHYGDVRMEFGQRVTWNVGRHLFGLSSDQPSMAIRLPMPTRPDPVAAPAPIVARALP